MKKFISAVSAVALVVSSMPLINAVPQVSAEDDAIKIMCIGDSITDGYTYDYVGSYRKFIYHNLTEMGYNIDMVGSKDGGWTPSYTDETGETWDFDNENTGYSGYAIKEYSGRSGIYETLISTDCLASAMPDIVTLQIGTNDIIDNHEIETAGERLEVLVDYILENISPDATLFISEIPALDPNRSGVYDWFGNYRHSADWSEQYDDETAENLVKSNVESYNLQIRNLAEKKQEQGKNVVLSDAGCMITDVSTQLFDGVHPNNTGYKAMGDEWTLLIDECLRGSSPSENVTTSTTTTTTTTTTTITTAATTETTTTITSASTETETSATTAATETSTETIQTTTTAAEEDDDTLKISDLVRVTRFILGYTTEIYSGTSGDKKYDLNNDERVDVFDTIIMRKLLTEECIKFTETTKEKFGEDFSLFPDGDNIVIYPDEYYENITTTTTAPPRAAASEIIEFETPTQTAEDIEKWLELNPPIS